ncbi:hypothetical protein ACFY2V_28155 [Streptomyces eurythermus]|uniref:hypothetical protein n=1 Tax=Streptomyces eurythermus TaxID=42237 RepID=UPI003693A9F4
MGTREHQVLRGEEAGADGLPACAADTDGRSLAGLGDHTGQRPLAPPAYQRGQGVAVGGNPAAALGADGRVYVFFRGGDGTLQHTRSMDLRYEEYTRLT